MVGGARKLGETDFYYCPDGTAHKNRMQGNDFPLNVMYRRGLRCFSCHDAHGYRQRLSITQARELHVPGMPRPGLAERTPHRHDEELTHHKMGSPGSDCRLVPHAGHQATIDDVKVPAHTFRFIIPAMTDQYKIPNPCISCHQDKSTSLATEALRRWPERSPWRLE